MRTRPGSIARPLALVLGILATVFSAGSCGRGSDVLDPLTDTPGSGIAVSGVVRSQTGQSLANAVVTLEQMQGGVTASVAARLEAAKRPGGDLSPGSAATTGTVLRSVVTDESGRFTFAGVATGNYVVSGALEHHLAGLQRVTIAVDSPASVLVDIVLTPTGSFLGSAMLENANVHQSTVVYVEGTSFVAVTDPAGGYTVSGVPMGNWTVRAAHPNYLDASTSGAIAAAGDSIALPAMTLLLDSNIPPVAAVTTPSRVVQLLPTSFAGSATDEDGTIVRYEWDFEDDGVFDYSSPSTATTTHTYASSGPVIAKLRVTDNRGAIGLRALSLNVEAPVFVSATTGSNGNPGTQDQPVHDISIGLNIATGSGRSTVLVATGNYVETLGIVNGKHVLGGFDPITWERLNASVMSVVNVSALGAVANGITQATEIGQLKFVAAAGPPGTSSIALRVQSSTGLLLFKDCWFQSSTAGIGGNGALEGTTGANGGAGQGGAPGTCDAAHGIGGSGGTSVACPGGGGGRGGLEGANPGLGGSSGSCSGGSGGNGGAGGDPGLAGTNGAAGTTGFSGFNGGTSAAGTGTIVGVNWVPLDSPNGFSGGTGTGGGGGGGGGGQGATFVNDGGGNGGGGGGGGGEGGGGGVGGSGGWASIAVYMFASAPTFTSCTFQSGTGGAGGAGRNGGAGGAGGPGGAGAAFCLAEIGRGGNGGAGGTGGPGGGGTGGPGGPSYCIVRAGSSTLVHTGSTFLPGTGGAGGAGGTSTALGAAPSGGTGTVATVVTL